MTLAPAPVVEAVELVEDGSCGELDIASASRDLKERNACGVVSSDCARTLHIRSLIDNSIGKDNIEDYRQCIPALAPLARPVHMCSLFPL